MASRYANTGLLPGSQGLETSNPGLAIWRAVTGGALSFETHTLKEGERLDHLAGQFYNDATMWWVIAAASGIGWGLQVPAGTFIRIPTDLTAIAGIV